MDIIKTTCPSSYKELDNDNYKIEVDNLNKSTYNQLMKLIIKFQLENEKKKKKIK